MLWRKLFAPSVGVILSFFLVGQVAAQPTTFADDTFNTGDWSATLLTPLTNNPDNFATVTQVPSGGNPGPYQQTRHNYFALTGNTQVSRIFVAHINANASYDPAQNEILNIEYLVDTGRFSGQYNDNEGELSLSIVGCDGYRLLLLQNGTYYRGNQSQNACADAFTSFGYTYNVAQNEFVRLSGVGPAQPDFSCAGSVIQFGYLTANQAGDPNQTNLQTISGIDNWKIDLDVKPCLPPPQLSITKTAPEECQAGSDCTFTITIENTGGPFTGQLQFGENTVPAGFTLQPANLPAMNNSSWLAAPPAACSPSSTPSLCQVLPALGGPFTMPANSAVSYEVTIPIPADFDGDAITNCVTLFADRQGVSEDCANVPVTSPDPSPFSTEHFQCYFVEEDTRLEPIRSPDVVLEDQFGRTENSIIKPVLLCAPVNKDGEGMENEKDHLVFYQLKERIPADALVEIENQFGTQRLKVLDSILLGVPSIKTIVEEPGEIDFSIDKTVERFELSQTLASEQYTLTVTNEGDSVDTPPYAITVTDNLPTGLYYTGFNAPGWTCLPPPVLPGPVTITCTWNGTPVTTPPGPMPAITLAVINTTGAPVENCADVEIVGSLDDIDLTNNEDCTPGTGGEPELTIHKEAVTQPCIVGQVCDFTVTISNSGAPFTGNLQVNDTTTPPGLNLQPLSPPMPSCAGLPGTTPANCSTGLVTITQGNPLSYTASLLVPDPMSQSWLQNCVELKDASGNSIANSCAGVEVVDNKTEERPDLDVHKRPLNGPVSVGDIVTFSIAIHNHGTTIGTGQSVQIVLTDVLPPGFVYTGTFSSSNGLWNCVANFGQIECTWTGGTPILQNASLGVISIETQVQKADGGQQCAEISITGMTDVNPLNDQDCIGVEVGPRSAGPGGGGTLPDTFACVSGLRSASSSLNMREEPSANAKILQELAQGTPLAVLGRQGNWSQVQIVGDGGAGPTGWVATRFTTEVRSPDQCSQRTQPETPPQENTPDPTPDAGSTPPTTGGEIVDEIINNILPDAGILPIGGTALGQAGLICEADLPFANFFLMLRSEPSCNAPVTEKLPRGSTVTILEQREGWSMVQIVDGDRRGPIGWGPAKAIDDVKWVIIVR